MALSGNETEVSLLDLRSSGVTALLETAVEGIAYGHHPQPGMRCSWCQYRSECKAWLPG